LASAVLSVCALASRPLLAVDEQIVTDRPDFVESSLTVGKGRFQIETSVAGEHDREGSLRSRTITTPTLLRFGIAEPLELRLESDGLDARTEDRTAQAATTTHGVTDSALGVKWHMLDGEGMRPSVGWLLHADLPSGSPSLRRHGIRPSLRASLEWELPHESSLGVMPGVIYDSADDGHRFTAGILGVTFGHNWTERFRTFAEVAAHQLATPVDGGNLVTCDFGLAYLITPTVQIDAALFIGANHQTPDVFWTLGLSAKF
jgi:hypothetical protein